MKRPNDLASLVETLTANSLTLAGINSIGGSVGNDRNAVNGDSAAASNGLDQLLTQLKQIASESHPAAVTTDRKSVV